MKKKFLPAILCLLIPLVVSAEELSAGGVPPSLSGMAIVKIKSKYIEMEFEQAVEVYQDKAMFLALDDFGGEIFQLIFDGGTLTVLAQGNLTQTKKDRLKKLLSLPLTQKEFLSLIQHHETVDFDVKSEGGRETWAHKKKKGLEVRFDDFMMDEAKNFPRHMRIEYKKNFLDLKWTRVLIHE